MLDDVGTRPDVYLVGDSRNSDERCAPGAEAGMNCRKRTVRYGSEPSFSNKPRLVLWPTKCSLQDCDERNGSKSGRNGEK
jgi:hypothetical protein